MEAKIMIRYGELSVKGRNKKNFINCLGENVRQALETYPNIKVKQDNDFMFVSLNGNDENAVIERLQDVFGIQSYSIAYEVPREFDQLKSAAKQIVAQKLQENPEIKTFKVATSRSDHHYELDTNAINRELGGDVYDAFPQLQVKMKHPDLTLRVKVRTKDFVISTDWIKGAGGLPVGSSQRAVLMLSGGIDSPVAGYLAMKRGIRVTAIHFASPPYTSPQALEKAKALAQKLTRYSGGYIQFVEIPFTHVQEEIKEKVPSEYLMTITRRMMMRIADRVREAFKGLAIINGESIGQVASQTLHSMYAINHVTSTPIIRPLVTMDKLEIIALAEKIDTFDLSIQPFEDCCTVFAPKSPKTRPKLHEVEKYEARMDVDALVEEAVANIKYERIDALTGMEDTPDDFEQLL